MLEEGILKSLMAGGAAGFAVDMTLFPLDTLKTRLQSSAGFWNSGGLRGLYKGIVPAATGSAPNAALFFMTYDTLKRHLKKHTNEKYEPIVHMVSASAGEIVACLIRVPAEVVKQRQQVNLKPISTLNVCREAVRLEGPRGLYRGFGSTVLREIPFSLIQFPLWELFKKKLSLYKHKTKTGDEQLSAMEVAMCGAFAGAASACLTTPLDVAKTRIMLTVAPQERRTVLQTLKTIYLKEGISSLYAGTIPRTLWMFLGGFVFFGVNEASKQILSNKVEEPC